MTTATMQRNGKVALLRETDLQEMYGVVVNMYGLVVNMYGLVVTNSEMRIPVL